MKKIAATCSLIVLKLLFQFPNGAMAHLRTDQITDPPTAVVRPNPAAQQLLQPPSSGPTVIVAPAIVPVPSAERFIKDPGSLRFDNLAEVDKDTVAYTIAQKALLNFLAESNRVAALKRLIKENAKTKIKKGNLWEDTTQRYDHLLEACKKYKMSKDEAFSKDEIIKTLAKYKTVAKPFCVDFQNKNGRLSGDAWKNKLWEYHERFYNLQVQGKTLRTALAEKQQQTIQFIQENPERAFSIYRTLGHRIHGIYGNLYNVLMPYKNAQMDQRLDILDYMEELAQNDTSMSEKAHFQAVLPGAKKVRERMEEEA